MVVFGDFCLYVIGGILVEIRWWDCRYFMISLVLVISFWWYVFIIYGEYDSFIGDRYYLKEL